MHATPARGDAAIEIRGVTKRFGRKRAVDSLDLVVPTGSVCGFLGPNGAGKTTTIRMIMSIIMPDEGELSVLGRKSSTESKDRIGYLPEERGVYRTMKVGEFLRHMGLLKGAPSRGLDAKIGELLERLALPGVVKKKCQELSKGMQQKVQFAATIIHEPELVILDEPFSGLDPVNARLLRELIDELHQQGTTIIFSTHVLFSAEQLCDRVFMINQGKKVLDGSIDEIREQFDPKTVVVEAMDGQTGAIEEMLGRVRGVRSVGHAGEAMLEAHMEEGGDPQEVIRAVTASHPVRRIEVRRATLEDIFVSLVAPTDSEDAVRASISSVNADVEAGANA